MDALSLSLDIQHIKCRGIWGFQIAKGFSNLSQPVETANDKDGGSYNREINFPKVLATQLQY